jgi:hypothetical protein
VREERSGNQRDVVKAAIQLYGPIDGTDHLGKPIGVDKGSLPDSGQVIPVVGLIKRFEDLDPITEMLDDGHKILYIPVNPGVSGLIFLARVFLSGLSKVISRLIGHSFAANESVDLNAPVQVALDDVVVGRLPVRGIRRRPRAKHKIDTDPGQFVGQFWVDGGVDVTRVEVYGTVDVQAYFTHDQTPCTDRFGAVPRPR